MGGKPWYDKNSLSWHVRQNWLFLKSSSSLTRIPDLNHICPFRFCSLVGFESLLHGHGHGKFNYANISRQRKCLTCSLGEDKKRMVGAVFVSWSQLRKCWPSENVLQLSPQTPTGKPLTISKKCNKLDEIVQCGVCSYDIKKLLATFQNLQDFFVFDSDETCERRFVLLKDATVTLWCHNLATGVHHGWPQNQPEQRQFFNEGCSKNCR